jgi:Flp pilus assembly protein TadB
MTVQPYDDNNDPADRSETSEIAELSRRTLGSEEIILDAPMSFTGMTKRTLRFSSRHASQKWWSKTLAVTGLVLWFTLAYATILCWYAIFGLLLVPFRLIRRSQRRDEQRRRQHAELLAGQNRRGDWR